MFGKKLNNSESRIFEMENLNENPVERKDEAEHHDQELKSCPAKSCVPH